MRLRVIALAAALLAAAPARAEAPEVTRFTLANGLEVVVIPDHRAPVVTHMVWYRAGGTDDPQGLSGIAHFFEHLMFKGTRRVAPGELSKIVARNGGQDNAFTTEDYTAYFQRIARDRLDLVMRLEADRMMNLDLSAENVATERDVVLEERRFRVENDPVALFREQLSAALHLSHPYGRPVIGWNEEIRRIGRDEALDFYRRHYAPNNAIVVVAGDVTPDEVRRLAQTHYGRLPRRALAARSDPAAPPRMTETRLAAEHPDVRQSLLLRIYRVPSYVTAAPGEAEALEVLADLLGGGAASRLYKGLVVERKLASAAGAWFAGAARGMTEFGVYAYPRDGVSLAALEKGMNAILADIKSAPPDTAELERTKTVLVADAVYARDSQATMARIYGEALSIGLTVEDVQVWPERIRAVTAEEVQAAAKARLIERESVTGTLEPKAKK